LNLNNKRQQLFGCVLTQVLLITGILLLTVDSGAVMNMMDAIVLASMLGNIIHFVRFPRVLISFVYSNIDNASLQKYSKETLQVRGCN
jgi:hypothetical protein